MIRRASKCRSSRTSEQATRSGGRRRTASDPNNHRRFERKSAFSANAAEGVTGDRNQGTVQSDWNRGSGVTACQNTCLDRRHLERSKRIYQMRHCQTRSTQSYSHSTHHTHTEPVILTLRHPKSHSPTITLSSPFTVGIFIAGT